MPRYYYYDGYYGPAYGRRRCGGPSYYPGPRYYPGPYYDPQVAVIEAPPTRSGYAQGVVLRNPPPVGSQYAPPVYPQESYYYSPAYSRSQLPTTNSTSTYSGTQVVVSQGQNEMTPTPGQQNLPTVDVLDFNGVGAKKFYIMVPEQVVGGQVFKVHLDDVEYSVRCPETSTAGDVIIVNAPRVPRCNEYFPSHPHSSTTSIVLKLQ